MNVFDILGPVMIGPSSSHTAGAARIGGIARAVLAAEPVRAVIQLHGSFAKTYKGHVTDKAIIAGIMGMAPDDERIRRAPELAEAAGLAISIETVELDGAHPNTARILLWDASGRSVTVQGASVGGGNILITAVNGMEVQITGQYTSLIVLHRDTPGTIAAVTDAIFPTSSVRMNGVTFSPFRNTCCFPSSSYPRLTRIFGHSAEIRSVS